MSPFSRRAVWLIVGLSSLSLACALLFSVIGSDTAEADDHRPGVHSPSALGHRAFVELLRAVGVDVVVSHHDSANKAKGALLVLAEPGATGVDKLVKEAGHVLLVLPKRTGTPRTDRRTWVDSTSLVPVEDVQAVLTAAGVHGSIVRPAALAIDTDELATRPTIDQPQMIDSAELEDVVSSPDGILVGRVDNVWILADPDVLANHGLGRGDNAPFVVELLDRARDGTPIIVDETLHGRDHVSSIWIELASFPFSCVSIAVLLAVALGLVAGGLRFGAPLPPPPVVERGKRLLIDRTAELLDRGGHAGEVLSRYLQNTIADVARAMHAPPDLDGPRLRAWLEQLARARGVAANFAELDAAVDEAARAGRRAPALVAVTARRIHSFRQKLIGGTT